MKAKYWLIYNDKYGKGRRCKPFLTYESANTWSKSHNGIETIAITKVIKEDN